MIGATRYYAARFFAARYWPKIGSGVVVVLNICDTSTASLNPVRTTASLMPVRSTSAYCEG